jgi:hypothetical protein
LNESAEASEVIWGDYGVGAQGKLTPGSIIELDTLGLANSIRDFLYDQMDLDAQISATIFTITGCLKGNSRSEKLAVLRFNNFMQARRSRLTLCYEDVHRAVWSFEELGDALREQRCFGLSFPTLRDHE